MQVNDKRHFTHDLYTSGLKKMFEQSSVIFSW
jgi:hypothetical protein